ncbi:alpha-2-macroglobulin family protein [Methylobacterium sp. J-030]|uniref:alpha-2-macroglobulin family protein n=1 Tax=Methylobacterium sp. J-030 TaxID=2836627 RepID=UPI001FBA0F48|nr:alpha-2-macroglobulin [Methylobacterium sp. J-030]MCJ2068590.1 alpha-2-macroglobulin family protein [Methylobacterium sp. J-030]
MARLGRLAGALALLGWVAGAPVLAQNVAAPRIAQRPAATVPAPVAKPFVRADLASAAVRLEAALKAEAGLALRPAGQSRTNGQALLAASKPDQALISLAAAVAADPADIRNWQAYARAASAAQGALEQNDYQGRARLRERAAAAAYRAYERAGTAPDAAVSLALLGATEAEQESWRPALDAYAASLALDEDDGVRETYDTLRAEHGFRILGYKVDSDAAAPRACFTLSEAVVPKTDYAPYVAVSGTSAAAVTAEGSQVCVDGLKHGGRYAIVLRQGLPSAVGEDLLKSADYEIYVRDRAPQVRVTGRNYVLPRTGQAGVPLVSVNAPKLDVEVLRIGDRGLLPTLRSEDFLGQLSGATAKSIAAEKGVRVWTGTLDTARAELNQEAVTAFPVLQAVGKLEPGIYVMLARPSGTAATDDAGYDTQATQWFVVSDLGLTATKGRDGVHVVLRSLASAQVMPGAEIRLVARNNEVLGTRTTDAQGHAAFDPGLARGDGGLAPSLVVAQAGSDYGFLDLNLGAFDLTDRGVKGRPETGGLDAYLFPERGVYRSGETVQLTALLRDAAGAAVPDLPLTLVVKRPDGVEYRRVSVPDQGLGGRALPLPLLSGAMHGTWRVSAYTDPKAPTLGETSFLVEDYIPERLEVTLKPRQAALHRGEAAQVDVAARYLYGAPGADLDVSGSVTVQAAATSGIKGLEGYSIGLEDEAVEPATQELQDHATTNPQGGADVTVPVPLVAAPRALEAKITLAVGEPGGRALSRSLTLPILPAGPVLALRKGFSELQDGGIAGFDVVLASPEGSLLARPGVSWTLSRVDQSYQWYRADGRWSFEPVKTTKRVASGTVDLRANGPSRIEAPVGLGRYRLDVSAPGAPEASASLGFDVGWGGSQTAEAPDLLDLTLDKPAYAAGDTLRAKLSPKFKGQASLMVVSDRVHETREVSVPEGGATVTLPVKAEWGAGAYLIATAYRPLDQAAKRLPGRALGLAWFSVDRDRRSLGVAVKAPERARPRQDLTLPVQLTGLKPGTPARITVALVDVGILNLTRYAAPDPTQYFLGQKALGPELRDLYGYLIDGMQGSVGAIRSGGDAGGGELADAPPTQAPLALYSGVVTVGPDGAASVTFPLPAFNGTGRVMVTAWSGDRVGQAQADVIIRDPVVLTATLPRFLDAGDRSRLFVALDNVEGPAGDYTVDLSPTGPVVVGASALRQTFRLEAGAKGQFAIPLTAAGPGTARLDLALSGPGLASPLNQSFALGIAPGTSTLLRRSVRSLAPGAALTVTSDLIADLLPGTGSVSLSVTPLPGLDVAALLQALDRYPYGCSEQVVSRAMPLLYVNKLAALEKLALDAGVDDRVRESVERLLARQDSSGDFGLWSAQGSSDLWLDAYVTDFLTRARERGFAVPQKAFTQALDYLRNAVANASEVRNGGADLAYAAYVLARNGRPVMGDLRYLADTKLADFSSALGRAQLAAALALLGDRGRAARAMDSALTVLRGERDKGVYRADYGSRLRDGAGLITLAAESGLAPGALGPVAAVFGEEQQTERATSTQENAWMVLAAESLSKEADALSFSLDGAPQTGTLARVYREARLAERGVQLVNSGRGPVQVAVTVNGNPLTPEPAAAQGYTVERSFHRLDGSRVDPAAGLRQNDRLVVVLKVTEAKAEAARLLLVDPLPAGLEIDNPKLLDADVLQGLAFTKSDVQPVHTEFRDDRFVAAYDRDPSQSAFFTVAYTVRAVSPGTYVHPGATVEDMYRPARFGRTATGSVTVGAAK